MSLVKINYPTDKGEVPYGECQLLSYISKSEPGTIHTKHKLSKTETLIYYNHYNNYSGYNEYNNIDLQRSEE